MRHPRRGRPDRGLALALLRPDGHDSLDIKKGSPFKYSFPVELANDCTGYVPTEEALGPHGGGYETRLTVYSNLEPTAGTQMVQAALELARQMKPGEEPQPRRVTTEGTPWSYGNVPPESK